MSKSSVPLALATEFEELSGHVGSYFNRNKTPKQAWKSLEDEQDLMQGGFLSEPESLTNLLPENAHFVAIALFGRVKFNESPEITRMISDPAKVTFDELKKAQCISVAPSARPLLDALIPTGKLPKVLALCALVGQHLKLPAHP